MLLFLYVIYESIAEKTGKTIPSVVNKIVRWHPIGANRKVGHAR